ncbi:mechanosensitive ion channel family protein [Carboxylicivirga linearis]|uniref:Mechanosensitive ion channel n=1 Tax=Carboxylicivirga linearis TaxID=1628157 RepID=A0ABS5JX56_9BACT|nr:mechanosensitive ion channel domain-containing protein [Carboxylicivirga linearis]MBS2099495.1 mechanosensitive ion channel [Carboxylicivirga linearis]
MEIFGYTIETEKIQDLVITYGTKLIIGLLILIVGLWVIGFIVRGFKKVLKARSVDPTLVPFLVSIIGVTLKIMLVISVITYMGVNMTSFIAILGAAGLAVGMALSGTLQNFAGGVILLILRPFKVGDFIEAQGYMGTVKEIQIFNTILHTPDNKMVIIPNGGLSTGAMINFSAQDTRRVDFTFGIGYGDDIDKARNVILGVIAKNDKILKDPEPFVGVIEHGDNSVNLVTRVWSSTADYWGVYFFMMENVKKEFDAQGVSIPFPQRDIHIIKED